jgi:hypothetical protein
MKSATPGAPRRAKEADSTMRSIGAMAAARRSTREGAVIDMEHLLQAA